MRWQELKTWGQQEEEETCRLECNYILSVNYLRQLSRKAFSNMLGCLEI